MIKEIKLSKFKQREDSRRHSKRLLEVIHDVTLRKKQTHIK